MGIATVDPPAPEKPFSEALANLRLQEDNLALLIGLVLDLLRLCQERHQLGPVQLATTAPTLIENLLWIPWVSGSGTWMIADLFTGGPDAGSYSGNVRTGDGDD